MIERQDQEPRITGPETTDLIREAQCLGDGVERDQLHPPEDRYVSEIKPKRFTIKIGDQVTEYVQKGDLLFACGKDGRPERYAGRTYPKPSPKPFRF